MAGKKRQKIADEMREFASGCSCYAIGQALMMYASIVQGGEDDEV